MIRKKEQELLTKVTQQFNYILKDYKCGICHDFLMSPLECSRCGNIFCKDCIYKWIEQRGSGTSCPYKCENISFMLPNPIIRKHVQGFQEIEREIDEKYKYLNASKEISVD